MRAGSSRTKAAVSVGCLFLFAAMIFFGRSKREVVPAAAALAIGTVESIVGNAEHRLPAKSEFSPLAEGASLASGELIFAHEASQVQLAFRGGASVRLQPGARLVGENDPAYQDAVLATVIEGDVDVLSPGAPHTFRLFKDGRDVTLANANERAAPVIVSGGGRRFPRGGGAVSEAVVTASTPAESPPPQPVARASDETGDSSSADSLSNDEIRHALRSAGGFFQRCYLTYLNRVKTPPTGASTITVGFTISSSGKVRDAKIVRSDFTDAVLNNCIVETVERTSFRAFKSADIPVLEFPIELR